MQLVDTKFCIFFYLNKVVILLPNLLASGAILDTASNDCTWITTDFSLFILLSFNNYLNKKYQVKVLVTKLKCSESRPASF